MNSPSLAGAWLRRIAAAIALAVVLVGLILVFGFPQGIHLSGSTSSSSTNDPSGGVSHFAVNETMEISGVVLVVILIFLFGWLILELRRRYDETAEMIPLLNKLQRTLGGDAGHQDAGQEELGAGHGTVMDVMFLLIARIANLDQRVRVLERGPGAETAATGQSRSRAQDPPLSAHAQNSQTNRLLPDEWLRAVEEDYNQLFYNAKSAAFAQFIERHVVVPVRIAGEDCLEISNERPADAKFWVVENRELGVAAGFPGQKLFELFGSYSIDGGSGLRPVLGNIFVIEQGTRYEVTPVQVQAGKNGEFFVKSQGRLMLSTQR